MDLYRQQNANRKMTMLVVAAFIALFIFIGLGIDAFFFGTRMPGALGGIYPSQGASRLPYAAIIAAIAAAGMALNAVASGAKMVLSSTMAREANPADAAEKQFLNVVEEMAIAAGLPKPKAYVVPDDDPNAFAAGFSPETASIAVTRGLLSRLSREELQGVVAHEMSHIRNYDVRLMTMVAALAGALVLISDFVVRSGRYGGRRDSRSGRSSGGGLVFFVWLFLVIFAPLITRLLAMAVSRYREYLADASGAELTRNPLSLASALEKIQAASDPTVSINRGVAHMCIADPQGGFWEAKRGIIGDLLATHPPMDKRIAALKMMAYQRPGIIT